MKLQKMKKYDFMVAVSIISMVGILTITDEAQASLIQNGDFGTPNVGGSFVTLNTAPTGFGWTIVSDGTPSGTSTTGITGVDLINSFWVGTGGRIDPEGIDQSLDIDRLSSISQSFATTIGQEYTVGFSYSHHPFVTASLGRVSVDGLSSLISEVLLHNTPNSQANMQWNPFIQTFTADSTMTTLMLEGNLTNNSFGFAVDNIQVVSASAIPIPATALLVSTGLLALITPWMKRRISV